MSSSHWPEFRGALVTDEAGLQPYCSDFGGLVHAAPRAVLQPASVEDVVSAVRFARREGIPLVARGQGHTTRGQSLAAGGLVLDMTRLDRVLEIEPDRVWVEAGARWSELVRRTFVERKTPPVLTDYLDLSVGGTLSVGGVGGQSFRHGLQVDNVLELGVVTGDGELRRCSPASEPALFDACRGGMGQFGVIVDATVRLVDAPAHVRLHQPELPDLASFLEAQARLVDDGRFDYVLGNLEPRIGGFRYSLDCMRHELEPTDEQTLLDGLPCTVPSRDFGYLEFVLRLEAMAAAMRASGTWRGLHPWIDLFIPGGAAAERFLQRTLARITAEDVGDGYVMTYPLRRALCRTASPGLPDVAGEHALLFDILPSLPPERMPGFEETCGRILADAREIGATVYPIGYPVGTAAMRPVHWNQQWGTRAPELARAKRSYDPDGVFPAPCFDMRFEG